MLFRALLPFSVLALAACANEEEQTQPDARDEAAFEELDRLLEQEPLPAPPPGEEPDPAGAPR